MYKFLGLFAVFAVALGCFPIGDGGEGDDGEISDSAITNSVIFDLSYSPPVEWTAPTNGGIDNSSRQMPTLEIASDVARKMIQSALLEAFVDVGILPPKNIDYGLDKFDGQSINATANQTLANNNDGIVINGIVANKCVKAATDTAPAGGDSGDGGDGTDGNNGRIRMKRQATPKFCDSLSPNVVDQSFTIKSGPTLTGRQWKEISNKLAKAFIDENVRLDKPIIVTDSN